MSGFLVREVTLQSKKSEVHSKKWREREGDAVFHYLSVHS